MIKWCDWKPMPGPTECRNIIGPEGPGVYQIRNKKTGQYIQFGESQNCRKRMKSFFPKPYGAGTRNNEMKRNYILTNWKVLEYRTCPTNSKAEAVEIDRNLESLNNHLFNT
jgi:excinuclease UvrABC nuclease subunit